MYAGTLRGVGFQAAVRCYVVWKIQRLQEAVEGSDEARALLTSLDCHSLLRREGVPALRKEGFQVVFAG